LVGKSKKKVEGARKSVIFFNRTRIAQVVTIQSAVALLSVGNQRNGLENDGTSCIRVNNTETEMAQTVEVLKNERMT
jgi:hypothetical protein